MEAELHRITPSTTSDLRLTIRKKPIHEIINQFKTRLYLNLKSRFSYANSKLNLMGATLLDPRFKELTFEEYLDSDALKKAKKYVIQEALKLKEAPEDNTTENTIEPPKAPESSGKKVSNL